MSKPSICIVGLKCYDLLTGADTPRYIGGIENQLVLLGRGLAQRGHRVSFVTFDHGQPDGVQCEGIRIYKAFGSKAGIPGVRFFHPRWTRLCAALRRADADVYYQMGAGCEAGQVAMWCQQRRRSFVFAVASDSDCMSHLPGLSRGRDRYMFSYGLNKANSVIAQTHKQQELLRTHWRMSSRIVGAFTAQPSSEARDGVLTTSTKRRRILWVGRICRSKRPHLLSEIAQEVPECTFDVVGDANAATEYAHRVRAESENLPSLVLHGKVSSQVLDKMYDEAAVLINTSEIEGFPITFVEAWGRGIPVISTFDPDGVIAKHGLGWHVSTVEEFGGTLRMVLADSEMWCRASTAARSYYLANHTVDAAVATFERLFQDVTRGQRSLSSEGVIS